MTFNYYVLLISRVQNLCFLDKEFTYERKQQLNQKHYMTYATETRSIIIDNNL